MSCLICEDVWQFISVHILALSSMYILIASSLTNMLD